MKRYNLFETTHLALQDALFMGAQSLSKHHLLSDTTVYDVQTLKAIVEGCMQLTHLKEVLIMPALEAYEPAVVDALKQQHKKAATWAQQLVAAFTQPDGEQLRALYKKYMCAQLQCDIRCEEMLNPPLWFYYSDKELQHLEQPLLQVAGNFTQRQAA